MSERFNVLVISHHPALTTSYARVTREIVRGLRSAGCYTHVVGMCLNPSSTISVEDTTSVAMQPEAIRRVLEEALASRPYNVLLTIGDPWMFENIPGIARGKTRWAAYFPVDSSPFPQQWVPWLNAIDHPIVYSAFARQELAKHTSNVIRVIEHGVDTEVFKPMDKALAKARVGVEGHFVVGTVAANQQRKNLPALLRAFAEFSKGKSDVLLYLHTSIEGPCWNLLELAKELQIEAATRATLEYDPANGVTDDELATIYNSFDVFALPTMAEGFGLPILEAQACGVPALATDCSACTELLPDPLQRLRVKQTLKMTRDVEQAVVDEQDLSSKLERLYRDRETLEWLGKQSLEFAQSMPWDRQVRKLIDAMRDVSV